jgi:5'-AMP-activated protein kinase, catalytic alpha subunit
VKTQGAATASSIVQGGIYNLPSHLSPGARDLIPRMLLVDPLKRITIPEIRCSKLVMLTLCLLRWTVLSLPNPIAHAEL